VTDKEAMFLATLTDRVVPAATEAATVACQCPVCPSMKSIVVLGVLLFIVGIVVGVLGSAMRFAQSFRFW